MKWIFWLTLSLLGENEITSLSPLAETMVQTFSNRSTLAERINVASLVYLAWVTGYAATLANNG